MLSRNPVLTVREQSEQNLLVLFLDWMNEVANSDPMQFETDHDDIALMFLMELRRRKTGIKQ